MLARSISCVLSLCQLCLLIGDKTKLIEEDRPGTSHSMCHQAKLAPSRISAVSATRNTLNYINRCYKRIIQWTDRNTWTNAKSNY
jgi:hypothetical protein